MTLRSFFKDEGNEDEKVSHEKSSIFHDLVQDKLLQELIAGLAVKVVFVEESKNSENISCKISIKKALFGPFSVREDLVKFFRKCKAKCF